MRFSSETGRLVAVAVLSAGLVATAPAAATAVKQVVNADKVDWLHAVKAKASVRGFSTGWTPRRSSGPPSPLRSTANRS